MVTSRWKPLPPAVTGASRELAEQLRSLLDREGLSLRQLSTHDDIPYSLTTLHRVFSGQALPPRPLIDAIASKCGGDLVQLRNALDRAYQAGRESGGRSGRPAGRQRVPPATRHGRSSPRARMTLIGGLALAVAVAGVGILAVSAINGNDDLRPSPADAARSPRQGEPSRPAEPASAVVGTIRDDTAGLSYARLGGKWTTQESDWIRDRGWSTGQDAIAMRNIDGNNNNYMSSCLSGRLRRSIDYSGPGDLRAAAERLASSMQTDNDFYPQEHVRRDIESRAFQVSGRPGWLVRFELRFPQAKREGWNFTTEAVAFLVVDRGPGRRPGQLYITLPDSHRNQGDLALLLGSVRAH